MKNALPLKLALGAAALLLAAVEARASQSPFGIATPDSTGSYFGGPLAPVFAWVAVHQAHFYRALTAALSSLRNDPSGIWVLFGLSFAYGVFHAVGPGHGKAVITSYMLASGESARRGIALSFLSAAVQAVSAIVVVAIGAIALRITATAMTFATDWIEVVSYGAITLFGAWLLWSKIRGGHHHHHHHVLPGADDHVHEHDHGLAPALAAAGAHGDVHAFVAHDAAHDHDHHNRGHSHDHLHHDHAHDHAHAHAGDSRQPAENPSFGAFIARAWSAIVAVGIRPCSGAIIILVFALSQGLFASGVAATFIMAAGTGVTVAALATFAVYAKGIALRLTGSGSSSVAAWLGRAIEIGGAAAVLLLGIFLLGGALSTGLPG